MAGVLLLGVAMALGNVLYQYASTQDALDFWGRDVAELFGNKSTMTVTLLVPQETDKANPASQLTVSGLSYFTSDSRDASTAGGNLHFRRALLQKRLYDWSTSPRSLPDDDSIRWKFGVTFAKEGRAVTLVFSTDADYVSFIDSAGGQTGDQEMLKLLPNEQGVSPVKAFLEEQFAAASGGQAREF